MYKVAIFEITISFAITFFSIVIKVTSFDEFIVLVMEFFRMAVNKFCIINSFRDEFPIFVVNSFDVIFLEVRLFGLFAYISDF